MDRSVTPRASAQQRNSNNVEGNNYGGGYGLNGRRGKNRSRSGSEELSQIVAESQANQRFGENNNKNHFNGFWPLSNSFTRPQSVTPTPHSINANNVKNDENNSSLNSADQTRTTSPQAGLLSWVRNTIMMGPSGRPITREGIDQSQQTRSPVSQSDPVKRDQTPLLPGTLPSFHHIDQQKSLEPPLILRETPKSERSSISFDTVSGLGYDSVESYDYSTNSIRRHSTISISNSVSSSTDSNYRHRRSFTSGDGEQDEEDDDSDQEDVYAPFAQKQHGPSLIRPTARREALGFGTPSPPSSTLIDKNDKEEEDLRNTFGHRQGFLGSEHNLSVSEAAQDLGQTFVTDTDETRTIPSVVISTASPTLNQPSLEENNAMSPIAGWIEADHHHHHEQSTTPKPRMRKVQVNPSEDLINMNNEISQLGLNQTSLKPNAKVNHLTFLENSYDTNVTGDGEDLNDPLGRPKSPEELIRARQSRERVVLGSQGANTRAGQIAHIRRARAASSAKEKKKANEQKGDMSIDDGSNLSEHSDNVKVSKHLQRSASTSIASPRRRDIRFDSSSNAGVPAAGVAIAPQSSTIPNQFPRKEASEESSPISSSAINGGGQRIRKSFGFLGRRRERSQSSAGSVPTHSRSTSTSGVGGTSHSRKDSTSFWKLNVGNAKKSSALSSSHSAKDEKDEVSEKPRKSKELSISSNNDKLKPDHKLCSHSDEKLHKSDRQGALKGDIKPRRIRVRSRNKSSKEREFNKVFLVQEIFLSGRTPQNGTGGQTPSPSSSPALRPQIVSSNSNASQSSLAGSDSHQNQASIGKRKATWAMKFSLDGKYLAVAGQDAIIRVYGVLDSPNIRSSALQSMKESVNTPSDRKSTENHSSKEDQKMSGKRLGKEENDVEIDSAFVFTPDPIKEFKGHTSDILDLCWSKGGFLLSASMDKTARVWHLSWPNNLVAFVHGDFVTCAVFHPRDDRFFLSGSLDGKLRLWNISTKKVQASQEVPGLITACAFTHSGNTACVGTFSGAALFYQTDGLVFSSSVAVRSSSGKHQKGGRKITAIEPILSNDAFAKSNVEIVNENGQDINENKGKTSKSIGERVLITSNDSRIRAYDVETKSMLVRFKAKSYTNRSSQIRATLSEDNAFIISGSEATSNSEGGQVHIWASEQTLFDVSQKSLLAKIAMSGLNVVANANEKTTNLMKSGNLKNCDKGVGGGEKKVQKQKDRSDIFLDDSVEYFTAHAGTVTCAIIAPAESNTFLRKSFDPLLIKSDEKILQRLAESGNGEILSQIGKTISAAITNPLKSAPPSGNQQQLTSIKTTPQMINLSNKLNRILVTVDDQAIIRVWRNDNLNILATSNGKEKLH